MPNQTLLIVDDDPAMRETLNTIFAGDYNVHFASNGRDALDCVDSVRPDLVSLDIMMPGMDGFQTCLRLRPMEQTRTNPVHLLTSNRDP